MDSILFFHGEALRVSSITHLTPVISTVSGRYPFYFAVATRDRTHFFFFPSEAEAHCARKRLLSLLGNPS